MRFFLILLVSLILTACATGIDRSEMPRQSQVDTAELADPVDRVYLPRLDHWKPVDRSHLIVYQSPSRPFLVKLKQPVTNPQFNDLVIGIQRNNGYLTSNFDYVMIDGWRHYIESIRPLTREQADRIS